MLTDALAGDQQEMIRGVYGVLGASVPLVGGGAGDDLRMVTSRQIFGRKILQDAVVAACIGSDGPIGLALEHGWLSQGEPMMVTASSGNAVYALNDQPALDLYLERHQAPTGIESDPAAFAEFALTRPLAVGRRGDIAVRHVLGADLDHRGLSCAGSVPRGAAVWLAIGDRRPPWRRRTTPAPQPSRRLPGTRRWPCWSSTAPAGAPCWATPGWPPSAN